MRGRYLYLTKFNLYLRAAAYSLMTFILSIFLLNSGLRAEDLLRRVVPENRTSTPLRGLRVRLLFSGLRVAHERFSMLRKATPGSRVSISTFELENDEFGRSLAFEAIKAARRGVNVRILVDGLFITNLERKKLLNTLVRGGVEVKIYNPLEQVPFKALERMHSKFMAVEDVEKNSSVVLVGGRNLTDHYHRDTGLFDLDSRVETSLEQGKLLVRREFDSLWRSKPAMTFKQLSRKDYPEHEYEAELLRCEQSSRLMNYFIYRHLGEQKDPKEVVVESAYYVRNRGAKYSKGTNPELIGNAATESLHIGISVAQQSLLIGNAYFIPDVRFRKALSERLGAGVSVQVYTNSIKSSRSPKEKGVIYLMYGAVQNLIHKGMQLFMKQSYGEFHGKFMIVDHRVVEIGSTNLDPRSEFWDVNNGFVFDSPELAAQLEEVVENHKSKTPYERLTDMSGIKTVERCIRFLLSPIEGYF